MTDTPTREHMLETACADLLEQNQNCEYENKVLSETVHALRCELRECRAMIRMHIDEKHFNNMASDVFYDTRGERKQREAV